MYNRFHLSSSIQACVCITVQQEFHNQINIYNLENVLKKEFKVLADSWLTACEFLLKNIIPRYFIKDTDAVNFET